MRTLLMGAVSGIALFSIAAPATAQGIPVFDNSNTLQGIAQVANQVEQLINDARDFQAQVEQLLNLEAQLNALTGHRDWGDLGNGLPQYENRRLIPGTVDGFYELGAGEGAGEAAEIVRQLEEEFQPQSVEEAFPGQEDIPLARSHQRRREVVYGANASSAVVLNKHMERVANLEMMLQQLNQTNDVKDSADLQARIAAESTLVQAELAQLQAIQIQLLAAAETQRMVEDDNARRLSTFDSSGLANSIR